MLMLTYDVQAIIPILDGVGLAVLTFRAKTRNCSAKPQTLGFRKSIEMENHRLCNTPGGLANCVVCRLSQMAGRKDNTLHCHYWVCGCCSGITDSCKDELTASDSSSVQSVLYRGQVEPANTLHPEFCSRVESNASSTIDHINLILTLMTVQPFTTVCV